MKTKTKQVKVKIRIFMTSLCIGSFALSSCTTQSTAYQVQTQPMSQDLEKKVLRETGISGAATGAAVGAAAGAILGGGLTALAGGSSEQIRRNALIGAAGGGTAGGIKGYQEGQKKGQQMVAGSMTRDKARELVKGAREHNQHLANYNNGLRKKISTVRDFSDPKEKKRAYQTLAKQTDKRVKDTDKLIETRKKALESDQWAKGTNNEKSQYRRLTNEMVAERNAIATHLAQISKLEQAVVY